MLLDKSEFGIEKGYLLVMPIRKEEERRGIGRGDGIHFGGW
jgi:hypothetical protein